MVDVLGHKLESTEMPSPSSKQDSCDGDQILGKLQGFTMVDVLGHKLSREMPSPSSQQDSGDGDQVINHSELC